MTTTRHQIYMYVSSFWRRQRKTRYAETLTSTMKNVDDILQRSTLKWPSVWRSIIVTNETRRIHKDLSPPWDLHLSLPTDWWERISHWWTWFESRRMENVRRISCHATAVISAIYDIDYSVITLTWSCMQSHLDPWTTMTMRLTSRRRRINYWKMTLSSTFCFASRLWNIQIFSKLTDIWQCSNSQSRQSENERMNRFADVWWKTCLFSNDINSTSTLTTVSFSTGQIQIRSRIMDIKGMMMIIKWFNS